MPVPHELPGFLLTKFGDVGGVMAAVPGVQEEQPVHGEQVGVIGVAQGASELGGLERAPYADPALVQGIQ